MISEEILGAKNKGIDPLKKIYLSHHGSSEFVGDLIQVLQSNKSLRKEASWILKYAIEQGVLLNQSQTNSLLKILKSAENWETQLHILQLIPKLELNKKQGELIESRVYELLKSDRPFVRAGAFEAYEAITKLFPELQNEFQILCEEALIKDSASVQVKARRALKRLKKTK